MFGISGNVVGSVVTGPTRLPVDADTVRGWTRSLGSAELAADDPQRIELLRALEELTCAAAGAQAVVTAEFARSQRAEQAAAGVPSARQGRGVASQVAFARRESPHRGQRHLGLAVVLSDEMPHTLSALRAGQVTEFRATLMAQETACLSRSDRATVDRAIAGDPEAFSAYSDRELVGDVRRLAYQLDPGSVVGRRRKAEADRRVTLRPAPDVMSQLSALLPVAQGVAVFAALSKEADRLRAAGDERSRGQLMADLLVVRATGARPVVPGGPPVVPTTVDVVLSDQTLLGGDHEPAHLDGFGQIPADLARRLAHDTLDAGLELWLRRLYAGNDGRLVAMDSRARLFPRMLAKLIVFRDQLCRTPWCGAPIRHLDHALDHDAGGQTSLDNGQGLCEACNHAKQAPGWRAGPAPDGSIETATPTGHTVRSRPPRAPQPYDAA
ncbi:HNH endonuclease [Nocardioides jejuensis]|uniref:DUF222 domain-containing protein n=1 Tax=Nocardioides jejuensis TaxID=2502782 RepID=A0A4R1CJ54_9ACTN|nr:DUF222 domain-containing protein [Nocardioides jejuensis]TCJ30877.1 DUF222 domain-containing protein [Nocardioides jejuensis]